MRKMILGMAEDYPAGLWKFVPSNSPFLDPLIPWDYDPERRYAQHMGDAMGHDYIGIKLGDVNASWSP